MKRFLFICVGNSGRSQLAEAIARHSGGGEVEVKSGGTIPAERVSSKAVAVLKEWGLDISTARPKAIDWGFAKRCDAIVGMGCGDADFCPAPLVPRLEDWDLPDPKGRDLALYRALRDDIAARVRDLMARHGVPLREVRA